MRLLTERSLVRNRELRKSRGRRRDERARDLLSRRSNTIFEKKISSKSIEYIVKISEACVWCQQIFSYPETEIVHPFQSKALLKNSPGHSPQSPCLQLKYDRRSRRKTFPVFFESSQPYSALLSLRFALYIRNIFLDGPTHFTKQRAPANQLTLSALEVA